MKKYAKIVNEETKLCDVGLGTDIDFYETVGMTETDVEQAYTGDWYVAGFAPEKPAPTKEEIESLRRAAYIVEVDPITAHISRLKDVEQTLEITAEIALLQAERNEKVRVIKGTYPYPETEAADV